MTFFQTFKNKNDLYNDKQKNKIKFYIENNKYVFEWLHNDLLLKNTIGIYNKENIDCNMSFYQNKEILSFEDLNSNFGNIIEKYNNDLLSFIKGLDILRTDFGIFNFIKLLFKRKKSNIKFLNKKIIYSIFNNDYNSKIVTIASINSNYLNYIPEIFFMKGKSVFLLFHNSNLYLVNRLQILVIQKIFRLINLFIKIIRIISIFLTTVGITFPSISTFYQLNIDPIYIIISLSAAITFIVLFSFSSSLKLRILKIIINNYL